MPEHGCHVAHQVAVRDLHTLGPASGATGEHLQHMPHPSESLSIESRGPWAHQHAWYNLQLALAADNRFDGCLHLPDLQPA